MAWEDHVQTPPIMQVKVVHNDPLASILTAIGDVGALVTEIRHQDLAYLKQRVDAQWVAIGDLQKQKADRGEVKDVEERLQAAVKLQVGRVYDDVNRIEQVAESSDASFESLNKRLTQIEVETSKIENLAKTVTRLNRLSWQMAGAATTAGLFGLTIGFFLKVFVHASWLDHLTH